MIDRRRLGLMGLAMLGAVVGASCDGCDDESGAGPVGTGGSGAAGGSGGGGAPPVVPWQEPALDYRVTLTVRPHAERDRIDLPVIATFDHPGALVVPEVRVYELEGTASGPPLDASAWSQPDGEVLEVGFTAPGTTAAGEARTFHLYYDVTTEPVAWQWQADSWASFESLDADSNGTPDGLRLEGGAYAIERARSESDGSLVGWRQPDGGSTLEHLPTSWLVANGFSSSYQLESGTASYEPTAVDGAPCDAIETAGTEAWAAVAVRLRDRPDPVLHDAAQSYRLFAAWPFLEMVLSVSDPTGTSSLSGADYTGRTLYLVDSVDRMLSDTRGDEALATVWDTSMRWLVVYDSGSNRGFGWFIPHPGVVRASSSDGATIYDSYAGSAGASLAYRYLWMADADKDAIATLFDEMAPGVTVSQPENRDLNILVPVENSFYFPEDALAVTVTTPGSSLPVSATLRAPNGAEQSVALGNSTDPLRWVALAPVVFDTSSAEGSWTVQAASGEATAEASFELRLPHHPKLMFGADELSGIVTRKDDPAYAEIWQSMLDDAAGLEAPIPDPGPGRDIRSYGERLTNLALVQLVDPAQPYDAMLWDYFFTMLRYPNWDPNAAESFNNLDLTVGHFLTALSLVYDWHYDALSPEERAEVRGFLRETTERWLTTSYLRHYRDIEYPNYGSVTGNHYWINHEGVAAATYVLADEMPEAIRSEWVAHLEENLATILSVLEDDGTSHEGVAYHSYGQINLFPWLDMRDRVTGQNSAEATPWFAESVLYDLYSVVPGGDDNYGGVANFGDCPPRHYNPPRTINAWLARRLGDGHAQWAAQSLAAPRISPLSYLWYDPTIEAVAPTSLPTSHLFPHKGIFAWRSSWADDASYVSLKCGSYFGGHEHPDAGHFILHRAGVPYVTDHGYSYRKATDEHNLVVIDDGEQLGAGGQWMAAVDPASWASVESALGDPAYFDVVANPTPMVESDTLSSWRRELVGLGRDLYVMHDELEAGGTLSALWLLHGYRSDPPTSAGATYTYTGRRLENPFSGPAAGPWLLTPQDAAPSLHVADVSFASWSASVEPSFYVPEQTPDGVYNEGQDSFQVGYRLERRASGSALGSTVALWFGDSVSAESWSTSGVEAVRFNDGATELAHVLWPASGSVTGFHGFDASAAMAGRRFDEPATFGRELTHLALSSTGELVTASAPIDLFARIEHGSPTASDPWRIVVRATGSTSVTLRCPTEPGAVTDELGAAVPFTWSGSQLSFTVASGEHRYVLAP